MKRFAGHLMCSGWAVLGALCMISAVAIAQDQLPAPVLGDPGADLLLRLASTVGMPGVVAWVAWQLRGLLTAGITVRLSDEDRELLRRPDRT